MDKKIPLVKGTRMRFDRIYKNITIIFGTTNFDLTDAHVKRPAFPESGPTIFGGSSGHVVFTDKPTITTILDNDDWLVLTVEES